MNAGKQPNVEWTGKQTNQPGRGKDRKSACYYFSATWKLKSLIQKIILPNFFERVRCALVLVAVNSQQITEFVRDRFQTFNNFTAVIKVNYEHIYVFHAPKKFSCYTQYIAAVHVNRYSF